MSVFVRIATILKRPLCSVLCWTLLFLVTTDVIVCYVKPLRLLDGLRLTGLNQSPAVTKLVDYLESSVNPEVLVLGSSLMLVPAVRCDDELQHIRARYDRWYYYGHVVAYDRADFFRGLLSRCSGRNVELANLAVAGGMVSDYYLVLKKAIATGKSPRMLICALSPRDFLDNWRSQVDKTYTYQALAGMDCLGDVLANNPNLTSLGEFLPGMIWQYYRHRADYRSFVQALTSRSFNRSTDLYSAIADRERRARTDPDGTSPDSQSAVATREDPTPNYTEPRDRLRDIAQYRRYYLPVNFRLFEKQSEYLEKLLTLAEEHDIRVVLVDMPLMKENLALLPGQIQDSYRTTIKTSARRHGATLISPSDREVFEAADFEDSCHLNASGGHKVFRAMASTAAGSLASR